MSFVPDRSSLPLPPLFYFFPPLLLFAWRLPGGFVLSHPHREWSVEARGRGKREALFENEANECFVVRNKIRNQFRALDEDEIGFLEEVEARKKEEAERGRREMDEGLRVFREARREERREEEAAAEEEGGEIVEGGWRVGAKRKRRKGEGEVAGLLKGVKRRVSSGVGGAEMEKDKEEDEEQEEQEEVGTGTSERDEAGATKRVEAASEPAEAKPKLGLVDYGSDDDSD